MALAELSNVLKSYSSQRHCQSFRIVQVFTSAIENEGSPLTIKLLFKQILDQIREEKDEVYKAALIGALKELINITNIGEYLNFSVIIEDLLPFLVSNKSKLMVAEILHAFQKIVTKYPCVSSDLNQKLITATKHLLFTNSSHLVKEQSLLLLSHLAVNDSTDTATGLEAQRECTIIIKILREFSHYHDPRVRCAALEAVLTLHQRGVRLDISLYYEFCEALSDDYEGCRIFAIKLLEVLSHIYGDCLVCVNSGDEQIRLVDDAFAKICSMMSDLSVNVRKQAALLLGNFVHVSSDFLEQTLDKKLMSNLRKKKTAHERNRENYASGEWASGKKWVDDAPHEEICPDSINLMDIGACGAIIHGLEDEFLEVRSATLESLCKLSLSFPGFAQQAMDFVVDMFNDEIEDIRLKAIQCLSKISVENIIIREDQVDIILFVLEDSSIDIREALHHTLGSCKIATKAGLKLCIESLLDNLKRYPEDRNSIWRCFQKLGKNHAELTAPLVIDLLMIHPFLDLPEPSLEDNLYISILILVFNAAGGVPSITSVFNNHTRKHYCYLRDSFPHLVPHLHDLDVNSELRITYDESSDEMNDTVVRFLTNIFSRIKNIMSSENIDVKAQSTVIELSISDLERLGQIEPFMSHASDFLKQYLQCQISLRKIMSNTNWINTFFLSPVQSNAFRSSLQQILQTTFCLINQFNGLHPLHLSFILQTRVKALALQLIAVIHGTNVSALALCDAFLEEVRTLKTHLSTHNLEADALTKEMIGEINKLNIPKPGSVARSLQPLLLSSPKLITQAKDLTQLVSEDTINSLKKLRKASAVINEPISRSESAIKFTAGLILTVRMDAILYNIKDLKAIRVKIHWPDQQTHFVLPKLSDFRAIENEIHNEGIQDYRLLTNIYLSHGVWSEPCPVAINIVGDFRETSSTIGISQTWASKTSSDVKIKPEESLIIELCKPVKLLIAPKQQRKNVL